MKKYISILVILALVAIVATAYAKADKWTLYKPDGTPTKSFAVINYPNDNSGITAIVTVQVRGLTPDATYEVWTQYSGPAVKLGEIMTNKAGNGALHVNWTQPIDVDEIHVITPPPWTLVLTS